MEYNQYDRDDLSLPWTEQRQQYMKGPQPKEEPAFPEEQPHEYTFYGESQRIPERWHHEVQRNVVQPAYTHRNETVSPLSAFKKYIIIGAILFFGFMSGLIVGHATGVIDSQPGPGPFFGSPAHQGPFEDHDFFHHRGGRGHEFGNDNDSQLPFSGSGVS